MVKQKNNKSLQKRQLPRRVTPLTLSRAFGQKSPLVREDLQGFLARCMNTEQWNSYDISQKQKILDSVPAGIRHTHDLDGAETHYQCVVSMADHVNKQSDQTTVQSISRVGDLSIPPINSSSLAEDALIKRTVARFKRDLQDGYYEKVWLDKARRAHEERLEGRFDGFVEAQAEEIFEEESEAQFSHKDELDMENDDGARVESAKGQRTGRG